MKQTSSRRIPNRPDNLWEPAPGAFGAHGRFDDRSRDASVELWLAKRKPWLALGRRGGRSAWRSAARREADGNELVRVVEPGAREARQSRRGGRRA